MKRKNYIIQTTILNTLLFIIFVVLYIQNYDLTPPTVKIINYKIQSNLLILNLNVSSTLPLEYIQIKDFDNKENITLDLNKRLKTIVTIFYPLDKNTHELNLKIKIKDIKRLKLKTQKLYLK